MNSRVARKSRKKKTAMCSFRIKHQLKEELQAIAKRQQRSLSSLLEKVLTNFLESQKQDLHSGTTKEDRRRYPRKNVMLPARWRLRKEKEIKEYDVLIRNISMGGVYTEYMDGELYRLFEDDQRLSLQLIARLPGSKEPIVLHCEPSRFHITHECLGMGLRYTENITEVTHASLNRYLSQT